MLLAAVGAAVKREMNPLYKVHRVVVVPSLPRNATNKVKPRPYTTTKKNQKKNPNKEKKKKKPKNNRVRNH
jgi:acyl-coenzyme A synthetase/AMP-(fatty) acid ligase